jgi:hypothetical protein
MTHVKEAASSQSAKARIDFYEAMWLFYRKHYRRQTLWLLDKLILAGIVGKGGVDVSRHLLRYCLRNDGATSEESPEGAQAPATAHTVQSARSSAPPTRSMPLPASAVQQAAQPSLTHDR